MNARSRDWAFFLFTVAAECVMEFSLLNNLIILGIRGHEGLRLA